MIPVYISTSSSPLLHLPQKPEITSDDGTLNLRLCNIVIDFQKQNAAKNQQQEQIKLKRPSISINTLEQSKMNAAVQNIVVKTPSIPHLEVNSPAHLRAQLLNDLASEVYDAKLCPAKLMPLRVKISSKLEQIPDRHLYELSRKSWVNPESNYRVCMSIQSDADHNALIKMKPFNESLYSDGYTILKELDFFIILSLLEDRQVPYARQKTANWLDLMNTEELCNFLIILLKPDLNESANLKEITRLKTKVLACLETVSAIDSAVYMAEKLHQYWHALYHIPIQAIRELDNMLILVQSLEQDFTTAEMNRAWTLIPDGQISSLSLALMHLSILNKKTHPVHIEKFYRTHFRAYLFNEDCLKALTKFIVGLDCVELFNKFQQIFSSHHDLLNAQNISCINKTLTNLATDHAKSVYADVMLHLSCKIKSQSSIQEFQRSLKWIQHLLTDDNQLKHFIRIYHAPDCLGNKRITLEQKNSIAIILLNWNKNIRNEVMNFIFSLVNENHNSGRKCNEGLEKSNLHDRIKINTLRLLTKWPIDPDSKETSLEFSKKVEQLLESYLKIPCKLN